MNLNEATDETSAARPCANSAEYSIYIRQHTPAYVSIRQHTSQTRLAQLAPVPTRPNTHVSRRQHASVSMRQHTSAYVSIRQHTPAYVSIRQHTSACMCQHMSEYVSICRHTPSYASIRQHTSAYVSSPLRERRRQYAHVCTSKASKVSTSRIRSTIACTNFRV
jgi:hypothetical protein